MISKLWFRFGIPLGSATVLTGLLEFGMACYWCLNEVGSYLYFHHTSWDHPVPSSYRTYLGLTAAVLRFILAISLWVFILLGQRAILLFWLPLSVITDGLLVANALNNVTRYDFVSDEVWFINIAVIVVLRFYMTCTVYQALHRLVQNAKAEEAMGTTSVRPEEGTTTEIEEHENGHSANSTHFTYDIVPRQDTGIKSEDDEGGDESQKSPRFLLMEPIGESPMQIAEYYNDTPRLGAAILVIFELVWNIFTLSTHFLTEFLLGGQIFFMIQEEEIFMRVWRIFVDVVAVVFIFRKRKTLLRFWLIVYFWTLFTSLCIFVYGLTETLDPPVIRIIVICCIFLGDNLVRFSIVYCVLRTTTQSPPLTPTSANVSPEPVYPDDDPVEVVEEGGKKKKKGVQRNHSLMSQTGPRIKRKKTRTSFGKSPMRRLIATPAMSTLTNAFS